MTLKIKLLMGVHHILMSNLPHADLLLEHSSQLSEIQGDSEESSPIQILLKKLFSLYLAYVLKVSSQYEKYVTVRDSKLSPK